MGKRILGLAHASGYIIHKIREEKKKNRLLRFSNETGGHNGRGKGRKPR
jgi:hypothetical protein